MTPDQVQALYEGCLSLVLSCYVIGLGIGLVIKLLRSAVDN
jgi:hypothetical protein